MSDSLYTADWTTQQQARASNPAASAWVSANAGSGKTHVLSQRVIRLLLDGARPSAILCLTYTKAAASEMSNRVFARLAGWTTLSDEALAQELFELEGSHPGPERLRLARRLFAHALETPGGLKIQTIHAFCEALLHQFPLEANVAGHFSVMDDGETATLLAEARRQLLTATAVEGDEELAEAFAIVLETAEESGLEALIDDLLARSSEIGRMHEAARRFGGIEAMLRQAFALEPGEAEETVKAEAWPLEGWSDGLIAAYATAADGQSKKTPHTFAAALADAQEAETANARFAILSKLFLKAGGEVKATLHHGACGPVDADMLQQAGRRHAVLADRVRVCRMLRLSLAAHCLAERLHADYERLKRHRGRLDFDDLVQRASSLLARNGASAWVHYKLDQGIDHILVDEAQDTSPPQWSIIGGLSGEFFAGEGMSPVTRTLFSVGDEKQSIYSFQGARPERFREEGRLAARRALAAGVRFEDVELKLSFRSTAEVLKAVDHVFEVPDHRRGLGPPESAVIHESARRQEPGRVEIWDMIARDPRTDEEDWTAAFDDTPESDPRAQLARRIAATIRDWIDHGARVEKGVTKRIRPADILVLVRKRDGFVNALTRELKHAPEVPVAGADRLRLADHIAVMDLVALGRVVSMPDDDLSLAALLKSPLFDLTEEDLFRLCHERPRDMSVSAHLRLLADEGVPPFAPIHARLQVFERLARRLSVHDLYAEILGPQGGRRQFLARLGSEVNDILDEFLAFALDHERAGLPGLQSFLAVLADQSPEIKRELEQGHDEVRIMTVHASKGLEAPVVFLVDSGGEAARAQHIPRLRSIPIEVSDGKAEDAIFWVPGKDEENSVSLAMKSMLATAAEEEYRRLLYVGMTRAADRLVICGYRGLKPPRGPHWHAMAEAALAERGGERVRFSVGGLDWDGWRFCLAREPAAFPEETPISDQGSSERRFEALLTPLPPPSRPPRPLAPSGASAVIDEAGAPAVTSPFRRAEGGGHASLERGRIIHRLLQALPAMTAGERAGAARGYLARVAPTWPEAEGEAVLQSVMRILGDPVFAGCFSKTSAAEVSVMGTVVLQGREHVISGRLDRIAVSKDRVLIVDYKTNRPPYRTVDEVPVDYRAQMALYREVLRPLYPGRTIETALIFTEAPVLIALPDAVLDAALADITTK